MQRYREPKKCLKRYILYFTKKRKRNMPNTEALLKYVTFHSKDFFSDYVLFKFLIKTCFKVIVK